MDEREAGELEQSCIGWPVDLESDVGIYCIGIRDMLNSGELQRNFEVRDMEAIEKALQDLISKLERRELEW
eukprot:10860198-Alexandrium_andersonii.AAC.1